MPTIEFHPTMLSSATYKYHSGDTGGFRAFARVTGESAPDPDNINYTWTFDNAPITGTMYTSFNVSKGVYNPAGVLTGVVAEVDANKPTIFGVNCPVLMTPPLMENMTTKQFKCTAQHKKGGNTITHTITITFQTEVTFETLFDARKGDYTVNDARAGIQHNTGWRPAYWDRVGVVGEVCQYGRLLVNIAAALEEKANSYLPYSNTPTALVPSRTFPVFNTTTKNITTPAGPSPDYGTNFFNGEAIGGVTKTLNYSTISITGITEMDNCTHSFDVGESLNAVGYSTNVVPITANVMNNVMNSLISVCPAYTYSGPSSAGGAPYRFVKPKDIMDIIAPLTPAVELTLPTETSNHPDGTEITALGALHVPDGYSMNYDSRTDYHGSRSTFVNRYNDVVTGTKIQAGISYIDLQPPNYSNIAYAGGTPRTVWDWYFTYGTHILRGEEIATKKRIPIVVVHTDPESTNGTIIKARHFSGIKEAISSLYVARESNGYPRINVHSGSQSLPNLPTQRASVNYRSDRITYEEDNVDDGTDYGAASTYHSSNQELNCLRPTGLGGVDSELTYYDILSDVITSAPETCPVIHTLTLSSLNTLKRCRGNISGGKTTFSVSQCTVQITKFENRQNIYDSFERWSEPSRLPLDTNLPFQTCTPVKCSSPDEKFASDQWQETIDYSTNMVRTIAPSTIYSHKANAVFGTRVGQTKNQSMMDVEGSLGAYNDLVWQDVDSVGVTPIDTAGVHTYVELSAPVDYSNGIAWSSASTYMNAGVSIPCSSPFWTDSQIDDYITSGYRVVSDTMTYTAIGNLASVNSQVSRAGRLWGGVGFVPTSEVGVWGPDVIGQPELAYSGSMAWVDTPPCTPIQLPDIYKIVCGSTWFRNQTVIILTEPNFNYYQNGGLKNSMLFCAS